MKFEKGKLLTVEEVRPLLEVDGLLWWDEHQNNSGGSFDRDDDVDHVIMIQAPNSNEADRKLVEVTEDTRHGWCECCGERWNYSFWGNGNPVPTSYSSAILDEGYSDWWGGGVILHTYSGLVLRTIDGEMFEVVRYE